MLWLGINLSLSILAQLAKPQAPAGATSQLYKLSLSQSLPFAKYEIESDQAPNRQK